MPKGTKKRKMVALELDAEDRKTAEKLQIAWKTSFSEVMRRSLREAAARQESARLSA